MINKIYKRIHNKYSILFKFIFFLRYLVAIFFVSGFLFLSIPHFFDFKNKDKIIKDYLLESYGLTINGYKNIKYNSLPIPNLEIQNIDISIDTDLISVNGASLIIYPKLFNIYDHENFDANKIIFYKNEILLSDSNFKKFVDYIHNLKSKVSFKNSDLRINRKEKPLINIKNIYFSNHGYNKDIIKGKLFGKKFKITISDKHNEVDFKLFKSGMSVNVNFNEFKKKSPISGIFKFKLLESKLKFNFDYDNKRLKIYKSYFRNKNLSFSNESIIIHQPFFSSSSIVKIEDINTKWFKKINLNKVLNSKEIIKKINTKNEINFKSKNFSKNLIDDLNLNIDLAYGRLMYSKKILISESVLACQGDMNLIEEYPILFFNCSITSRDKRKFLKKFTINYKNKNELFKLNVKGNINIFNNKINFDKISMNQSYKASKEDLKYFKQSFEDIIFNKNFFDIFNLKKIKDFILEIS